MAYCSQTLAGLSTDCTSSQGGIKKVYIANYQDDIYTVGTGTISAVSTAVTWYEYNFRKNTGSLTSTLNVDAANGVNYISTEVALVFTKMETTKRAEIQALALGQLAMVVVDANGKYWALGLENPVEATAGTGETGTAKSDGNKYSITLTDESTVYPYELSADAITALLAHVGE